MCSDIPSESPAGNPAGRFPPEKHAVLDAVFAAAEPIRPGMIEIPGDDGKTIMVSRAAALVWALGELDLYSRLNQLADSELVPSKLSPKFHAIAAAADKLLKALGADRYAARFGVPEQIREGLKHFAEQDAKEAGGFRNHPPEASRVLFDGEEITVPEFHEDRQLQDNIEGVFQIHRWACRAEEIARQKQEARPTGSDQAVFAVMEKGPEFKVYYEIFAIWEKVLGNPVRSSVSSGGNVSGPLICFTNSCLEFVAYPPPRSSKAVRAQARRYKRDMAKVDSHKT